MSYRYPDPDDAIGHGREPYPGYWEGSESALVDALVRAVAAAAPQRARALDAGCGTGRHLSRLARHFQTMAIDADETRLADARRRAAEEGLAVELSHVPLEAFADCHGFALLWCAYVLDHAATGMLDRLLARCAGLLHQDGVLAILTSHARRDTDRFTFVRMTGKHHEEIDVTESLFDEAAIALRTGVLPVHQFSERTLTDLLNRAGLTVLHRRVLHDLGAFGDLDRVVSRDWLINLHPYLRTRFGEDQLLLCVRDSDAHQERVRRILEAFARQVDHPAVIKNDVWRR